MDTKNYAEVLIDGKIYTLGGTEDEHYLQRVASYINDKIVQMKRQSGFTKQSQEYQNVMIQLNIADDYFKAVDRASVSERQREEMEKESYSLKHELVTTQMKLESLTKELEENRQQLEQMKKDLKKNNEELLKAKAMQAASAHVANVQNGGRR